MTAVYGYDSYGVMLGGRPERTAPAATSLLYSGEQYDADLGQYYLRARYYDQNGRFNRLDPYAGNRQDPQSLHKYAYCHGDPVNGVDPSGEMNLLIVGIAILIVIIICLFPNRIGEQDIVQEQSIVLEGVGSYIADLAEVITTIENLRQAYRNDPTIRLHVGESDECVALVKHFSGAPNAKLLWRRGRQVWGATDLKPGTAIATFDEHGRYPSKKGWTSALYVKQDQERMWIIDQWQGHPPAERWIKPYPDPATRRPNNARAYSVIAR